MSLLVTIEYPGVVRRGLGILTEMALVAGVLGLIRPSEVVVASLCKFTVPQWHGQELLGTKDSNQASSSSSSG